ncbi:MAG TPA: ABC transporter ATP-binding protein [Actinomycetota bacterium]|nr:ABC transporter ATP-binding protein [Actinomycetota bacterium]
MRAADGLLIQGVVAGYGAGAVLDGVSLTVSSGEVVGLIGPNGSGKTTLVRVLSRTLRPAAGRVLVAGGDPYASSAREAAARLAVVPQELAPAFAFTVEEVILMGRTPHVSGWRWGGLEDLRRARAAARVADVENLLPRSIDELSGGEKQRVVLAQALAQEAPVLVLDEPTTHLDLRHVADILVTVRELAEERGRAVLAIFHDLNIAAAHCDRIVVLSEGRIVADGSPEDVLTAQLIEHVYGVRATVVVSPVSGRPLVIVEPARPGVAAAPRASDR